MRLAVIGRMLVVIVFISDHVAVTAP